MSTDRSKCGIKVRDQSPTERVILFFPIAVCNSIALSFLRTNRSATTAAFPHFAAAIPLTPATHTTYRLSDFPEALSLHVRILLSRRDHSSSQLWLDPVLADDLSVLDRLLHLIPDDLVVRRSSELGRPKGLAMLFPADALLFASRESILLRE